MFFAENPIPGMNPWMQKYWGDIHTSLTTYARDELQSRLPSDLQARVEEYIGIETRSPPANDEDRISPDVHFSQRNELPSVANLYPSTTATIQEPFAEPEMVTRIVEPVTLRSIHIVDLKDRQRIVTAIEFISPGNKAKRKQVHHFQEKQERLLDGGASIVEIDLILGGLWVVSFPEAFCPPTKSRPYRIAVTRANTPHCTEFYEATYFKPLPNMRIPLRANEQDVQLPLQAILNRAYVSGRCGNAIDYSKPPEAPVTEAEVTEMMEWLKKKQAEAI